LLQLFLEMGEGLYLPKLPLSCDPPELSLPSYQEYRHELLAVIFKY
jgi:hypothetical protein